MNLARKRKKKLWNIRVKVIQIVIGLGEETEGIGNQWKNRDHLDYLIPEICQNVQ